MTARDVRVAIEAAREHVWPVPDRSMLQENARPAPRLPVEIFGPTWGEWLLAASDGAGGPTDYVAASLLASAAALIGNARWVSPWQSWREPAALWVALVGRPSSGKSSAQSAVTDLLRVLEEEASSEYPESRRRWQTEREMARATYERWQSEVKDAVKKELAAPEMPAAAVDPAEPMRPRLVINDATPEKLGQLMSVNPKGLLFTRDELAGWLEGFGRYNNGGDRGLWLEAFGGRSYVIDRVKTGSEPIRIGHFSVSILGGIQPDRVASALMAGDDDGLASRFLMVWPNQTLPRRPQRLASDAAALAGLRWLAGLRMASDERGSPVPVTLRLDEAAAARFQSWREQHAISEGELAGRLLSHWGKLPGIVLRLALVIELLRWSVRYDMSEPVAVGEPVVEAAIKLADLYFKPMGERAYGDAALPVVDHDAAAAARWILRRKPIIVNARELRRNACLPGVRDAQRVTAALESLAEAGWLVRVDTATGGRRRADYSVNPQLWE
jgi:hypothetical protein